MQKGNRMKKLAAIGYVLFALSSCHNGSSPRVPAGIIQPDSMVQVLLDIHIFQAMLQLGYYQKDSAQGVANKFSALLKKHHLTDEQYNKSLKYYGYHPALLDDIYEKVLNNLSQQKAELQGKKHS